MSRGRLRVSISKTNTMPKMKRNTSRTSLVTRVVLLAVVAGLVLGTTAQIVRADSFDTKINALEQKNEANQAALDDLGAQASSYKDAINRLQSQINSLQRSISANEAKQADLEKQIAQKQKEIDQERVVLGDILRSMYVDGQMSTIEMLATSNSLSDYVDKQAYRNSVQAKIQEAVAQITKLQQQLQAKKTAVEKLIAGLKDQKSQMAASKRKQASLLAYNQSQQGAYNAKVKANLAQIRKLEAAQAAAQAAYARSHGVNFYGTAGNGGYPNRWANVAKDSVLDNWGFWNRECVSYVAWKVSATGHYMPHWGGLYDGRHWGGNAFAWIHNADVDNIPRTGSPPSSWRSGVAVVWDKYDGVGSKGHVAYLEAVNSDGSIEVSQYNFFSASLGHGHFSRMHLSASDANQLDYVYF
jgi:peptidoglycan hydrolase CwlO-like protein